MQWVQPDSSLETLPSHPPLGFLGLKSLGPTFFCSSSGQGKELWRGQCGAGDCKGPSRGGEGKVTGTLSSPRGACGQGFLGLSIPKGKCPGVCPL